MLETIEPLAQPERPVTPDATRPTPARPRGRAKIAALAAVPAVLALVLGWRMIAHALTHESTDDAFVEGRIVTLSPRVAGHVLEVRFEDNELVTKGQVLVELDKRSLEVRVADARGGLAAAEARARALRQAAEYTRLTGGAQIAQATSALTGARASIESARAQVGTARARLDETHAQIAVADASLEQARADEVALVADRDRLDADERRYETASADSSVSRQDVERVRAEAATARARVVAAHSKIASAEASVRQAHAADATARQQVLQSEAQVAEAEARAGESEAQLSSALAAPTQLAQANAQADAADAEVVRSRATLADAELELSYATITATEDGRVTRKSVEPGAYVVVGQSLVSLVPRKLWVLANFKETQLRDVRPGQRVELRADAFPDQLLFGRVESLQSGTGARFSLLPTENASGNYVKVVQRVPVKIVFDPAPPLELALCPGMSIEPDVETERR